jgi:hypothetical protein
MRVSPFGSPRPAGDSRPRSRRGPRVKPFTPDPAGPPACQLINGMETTMLTDQTQWSLGRGKPLVPLRWQATSMDFYSASQQLTLRST